MYSNRGWSYSSGATPAQSSAYRRRRLRLPPLPRMSPLPVALLLVGAAAWYHFAFPGFTVRGHVVDALTDAPVAGARIWSSRAATQTTSDGTFVIDHIKPPDAVGLDAPGYRGQTLRVLEPFEAPSVRLD